MSLKAQPIGPIPEDTRRLAESLLEPTDLYRLVGEHLSEWVRDEDFADLYAREGKPALSPARLAMMTLLQFWENLSDRQAAHMVRVRIDWKFALHLPLDYAGFDPSVLSEFRTRLVAHQAQTRVFDALLERLKQLKLVRAGGIQRTDSLLVVAAVRNLTRLELVMETLRLALVALEKADLGWLVAHVPAEWAQRYGAWTQQERLVRERGERGRAEVERLSRQVGADGAALLGLLAQESTPEALRGLVAVKVLEQVWEQQYERVDGQIVFKPKLEADLREVIQTPQDPDARYTRKRDKECTGYRLHASETVEEDLPRILTDVQTTSAPEQDISQVPTIQEHLAQRDLLPQTQLVDSAYVSGEQIAQSQERGVCLLGPLQADSSAQAQRADGLCWEQFVVEADKQQVVCPGGAISGVWAPSRLAGHERGIQVVFSAKDCGSCPLYARCVTSAKPTPQGRRLLLSAYHSQIAQRREEQKTDAFVSLYRLRAGVEATMSEWVRAHGARTARYVGQAKVHLEHLLKGAALNLKRSARWLAGLDRVTQRRPSLRHLAAEPACA